MLACTTVRTTDTCHPGGYIFIISRMVAETTFYMPTEVYSAVGNISRPRLSPGATEFVILGTSDVLGVKPSRLALLLGTTASTAAKWLNGSRSPSPLYLGRIIQLWLWDSQGLRVKDMREVNWDYSLILWEGGNVTFEDHLPGGSGEVEEENRRSTWEMAEFRSQQLRQAGSLDARKGRLSFDGARPPQ